MMNSANLNESTGKPTELLTIDPTGEIIHEGPMATKQRYETYTEDDQAVWRELYKRQTENLEEIAFPTWLEAQETIGVHGQQIPRLCDIREKLMELTGWGPVPVDGFLDARDYFAYLAKRQFPTVPTLRTRKEIEFIVAPDLFHDAFGHLPMHSHPTFANFLQLFGRTALAAKTDEQMVEMQRLYWFTVEYCLIDLDGTLKVCGSGHMSGIKESRYSLTDAVEKRPFSLKSVCAQDFNPHVLQPIMFVIDSYDQLFEAMSAKADELGVEIN
jgi:phenylalanine-4-hydroxylase